MPAFHWTRRYFPVDRSFRPCWFRPGLWQERRLFWTASIPSMQGFGGKSPTSQSLPPFVSMAFAVGVVGGNFHSKRRRSNLVMVDEDTPSLHRGAHESLFLCICPSVPIRSSRRCQTSEPPGSWLFWGKPPCRPKRDRRILFIGVDSSVARTPHSREEEVGPEGAIRTIPF